MNCMQFRDSQSHFYIHAEILRAITASSWRLAKLGIALRGVQVVMSVPSTWRPFPPNDRRPKRQRPIRMIANRPKKRRGPDLSIEPSKPRQRPTLPQGCPCSTIGPGELNFRVRDGNGCDLSGVATRKKIEVRARLGGCLARLAYYSGE